MRECISPERKLTLPPQPAAGVLSRRDSLAAPLAEAGRRKLLAHERDGSPLRGEPREKTVQRAARDEKKLGRPPLADLVDELAQSHDLEVGQGLG